MSVEVELAELPGIGAQLNLIHGSLSTVVDTALVSAIPVMLASALNFFGDSVTQHVAMRFATHSIGDCSAIAPGLAHLLNGSEMIYPVTAEYALNDVMGGTVVDAAGTPLSA